VASLPTILLIRPRNRGRALCPVKRRPLKRPKMLINKRNHKKKRLFRKQISKESMERSDREKLRSKKLPWNNQRRRVTSASRSCRDLL
jgi:hypothetical protein